MMLYQVLAVMLVEPGEDTHGKQTLENYILRDTLLNIKNAWESGMYYR